MYKLINYYRKLFNFGGFKFISYTRDCLIIRNKIDWVTDFTNWMGEGLKEALEARNCSVVDLSGPEATPANVSYWLKSGNRKISKMIIDFDHGYPDRLVGQQNGKEATIIDKWNAQSLTKDLDVYTFACSTGADNGLGEYAVNHGCSSWLGYTETIVFDPFIPEEFKKCVWSYPLALAEGVPVRECLKILANEYRKLSDSFICRWDLEKLVLHVQ